MANTSYGGMTAMPELTASGAVIKRETDQAILQRAAAATALNYSTPAAVPSASMNMYYSNPMSYASMMAQQMTAAAQLPFG